MLVVSLFSCLLTGPISAAALSSELITNGDFENGDITPSGTLASLQSTSINAFNTTRSNYTGKWYRASGGAPSERPDLSVEATAPGANEYPYYFALNDQRVAEPGNADNHAMRAVQTLYQLVDVKENSSYTLSFRFRLPHAETGLTRLYVALSEPTKDAAGKIATTFTQALPVTSATVNGTDGLGTYILPESSGNKGAVQLSFSTTNTDWQNVTLNFTTGSFYDGLDSVYGDEHPIVLRFHFDITNVSVNDLTYTKQAIYYDDISLKETVDCVASAEFYDNDVKIATPNDYAAVSLQVDGQPVSTVFAGDSVTAMVDYDKESGAYRFLGWYKNGVMVSAEESYTFTATAGEVYTPRFASVNILGSSASFEGLENGQNLLVDVPTDDTSPDYPSGNLWGYNYNAGYFGQTREETITDKNGTTYQQTASGSKRTSTTFGSTVVEDAAVAHSGSKYLKLSGGVAPSLALENLTPDTDYTLSFYWCYDAGNPSDGTLKGCGITTTVNISNATLSGNAKVALANVVASAANPFNVTNNTAVKSVAATDRTWRQLTFTFNSGNFETLYLVFAPSDGKTPTVLLDDLVCQAKTPALPESITEYIGTAIRTTGTQALRYKFSISKDIVKNGIAGYDLVEYGSIAIRTDYLGGAALTKDGVYNYGDMNRTPVIGVAYDKEAGKNIIFEETDTDYIFTAALTNIGVNKATGVTNYDAWGYDYSVRNYAVFKNTETGALTTVYDENTAVASVFAVVEKIEADYEADGSPATGQLHDDYMAIQTLLGDTESEQRSKYEDWKAAQ